MKSLGSFIRYVRKSKELTQEQIAESLNIATPVLSKWENDKAVPSLDLLCKLCNILNVSIEECISAELSDGDKTLPPEKFDSLKLGENIRLLRIKNGWSQAEVGKRLFVSSQTVSKWEIGGISSLEVLGKLAELFGLTPTELLNGIERIRSIPEKQTTAEQLKKPYRLKIKFTAVILAVIIFMGAIAGLIAGLVLKNKNGDRQKDGDNTQTEQPDDSNPPQTEQPDDNNPPQPDDAVKIDFASPVKSFYSAEVSSICPDSYKFNTNKLLFFEVETGEEIYAAADGVVERCGSISICINHGNGLISGYSMIKALEIEVGSETKKGQLIGKTAAHHLDFGLTLNGEPVDPLEYLTELPEPVERHVHVWGEWQIGKFLHWLECSCGENSKLEPHTFKDNICTVCGYEIPNISTDIDKNTFCLPMQSNIYRVYEEDIIYNDGVTTDHYGIDFSADAGDNVYAASDGVIERITDKTDYCLIKIKHSSGIVSVYSGVIPKDNLSEGSKVKKGDLIAFVSETPINRECEDGPHLHFTMFFNGEYVNPLDYIPYKETQT